MRLFIENFFWFLSVGIRNLKIKIFSALWPNYSDIYRLLIKINNDCNYRCTTCENWKSKEKIFLSPSLQKKIIRKYKKKLLFLSLTGGEPFLHKKKLLSFLIKIIKSNPKLKYISINTNCSRPKAVKDISEKILCNFPRINLYLGLHYIPNKEWGEEKTGVKKSYFIYKKTEKVSKNLRKKFGKRFYFYKIFTISKKEDIFSLRKEKDLWLNFATISSFYNNRENSYIEKLDKDTKLKIIEKFISLNDKNLNFLNRLYIFNLKKVISSKRKRKCYAGINRIYINEKGEKFICSREIKKRTELPALICKDCWTACEANFDFPPDLFFPLFFFRI